MTMTKARFTMEQHTELGRLLAALQDTIQTETVKIETAYPTTKPGNSKRAVRALEDAFLSVAAARSAMENELFDENPSASTQVYFPVRGE